MCIHNIEICTNAYRRRVLPWSRWETCNRSRIKSGGDERKKVEDSVETLVACEMVEEKDAVGSKRVSKSAPSGNSAMILVNWSRHANILSGVFTDNRCICTGML